MENITTDKKFREARERLEFITKKFTELGSFELLPDDDKKEYKSLSDAIYLWEEIHHPLPGAQPKVYEVEFHEPYNGKRYYFFSSKAAIFDIFPKDVVGVSYQMLIRKHRDIIINPFFGKKCVIRAGYVISKKRTAVQNINM